MLDHAYLTDGVHLYEVLTVRNTENYGLQRGMLQTLMVRDCKTGDDRRLDELEAALCDRVVGLTT